ncbi:hypothetical protein [Streptomyces sp. NBC_00691]|uniref:hypothetical protein n=1 Tax=Streptomyces sp. NBC_00691 TaxID=2903671 RepID=UPI002E2EBC0E|nr:hypothetical protein [Streptomyces sp. NBC_00691]
MSAPPRITAPTGRASPRDLLAAQERHRLAREALPRIRAAATGWRNAAGVLMAGLVGFGLVKGRTDVGQLEPAWAAAVGFLLLAALVCGAWGAYLLNRAAHGPLATVPAGSRATRSAIEHRETRTALRAMRRGIGLGLGCACLLVVAVGTTWYGPSAKGPALEVTSPGTGTVCGTVTRVAEGTIWLKSGGTTTQIPLAGVTRLRTVEACP